MFRLGLLILLVLVLLGGVIAVFAQDAVEAAPVDAPVLEGPWLVLATISSTVGVFISFFHSWLKHPSLPGTVSDETKELVTTFIAFVLSAAAIWYAGPAAAVWLGTPLESVPFLGILLAAGASTVGSEGIQWLYQKSRQRPIAERDL